MRCFGVEFFELLIIASSVCFWSISALYLIRTRKKYTCKKTKNGSLRNARSFDEEIFAQLIKQHTEIAFRRILDAIRNEQEVLQTFIDKEKFEKSKKPSVKKDTSENRKRVKKICRNTAGVKSSKKDVYAEVLRLTDLGMSTKKISEKLKLPKGEIELIVSLKNNSSRPSRSNQPMI